MSNILVAVDFSGVTGRVIEHAARIARALSMEIHLIHVTPPDPDFVGYDAGPQTVRDSVAKTLRTEHHDLQSLAEELRASGVTAKALSVPGPTAETILREAKAIGVEMIVVGSHGHGALHRVLLGSVSEAVLHASTVPVLIVPARDALGVNVTSDTGR